MSFVSWDGFVLMLWVGMVTLPSQLQSEAGRVSSLAHPLEQHAVLQETGAGVRGKIELYYKLHI